MNKRIKSLADKTALLIPGVYTIEYESGKMGVEFTEDALEKFAELIIKECMRMCDTAQMGYLTHGLEKEASGAVSVKQYIEEHFGVEE